MPTMVRVLQARDDEGPAVRTPLVGTDLVALGLREGPADGTLQGVDVELDLLVEEAVQETVGACGLEEVTVGDPSEPVEHLFEGWCSHRRVL